MLSQSFITVMILCNFLYVIICDCFVLLKRKHKNEIYKELNFQFSLFFVFCSFINALSQFHTKFTINLCFVCVENVVVEATGLFDCSESAHRHTDFNLGEMRNLIEMAKIQILEVSHSIISLSLHWDPRFFVFYWWWDKVLCSNGVIKKMGRKEWVLEHTFSVNGLRCFRTAFRCQHTSLFVPSW